MAVDIAPELLLKIQTDFQKSIEQSARIKELYNLLKAGKATYKEASEYAELIGDFWRQHLKSTYILTCCRTGGYISTLPTG